MHHGSVALSIDMHKIEKTTSTKTYSASLLPCKIGYSAPLDITSRYWQPEAISSTSTTSKVSLASSTAKQDDHGLIVHFRGRKLRGCTYTLPKGYKGAWNEVGLQ